MAFYEAELKKSGECYENLKNKEELLDDFVKQIEYFTLFPPDTMTHLILFKNHYKRWCITPCYTIFPKDYKIIWTFTGDPFRDGWERLDWEYDDIEEITGLTKAEIMAEAFKTQGALLTEGGYRRYVRKHFRDDFETYMMCKFDERYGEEIRKMAAKVIEYEIEHWEGDTI